ncbi:MAG: hypothetical protein WKF54_10785 [Nocardioidaceae bacterium]
MTGDHPASAGSFDALVAEGMAVDVEAFADHSFDLVLNRHESFNPRDVRRVLRPGGWFLTQQVGGGDVSSLRDLLGLPARRVAWDVATARCRIEAEGLVLVAGDEDRSRTAFTDVAALVGYVRSAPWEVPDFDVDLLRPRLRAIHADCPCRAGHHDPAPVLAGRSKLRPGRAGRSSLVRRQGLEPRTRRLRVRPGTCRAVISHDRGCCFRRSARSDGAA